MNVVDVEGIGPVYAEKLLKAGIRTVEGLLKGGATPEGRKSIAAAAGVGEHLILEWVNRADLYRIKGIGRQYSDLLENAGVDSVVELANRVPEHLLQRMDEVNKAKNLVNKLPSGKQVADWIRQAKRLPRAVKY